MWQDLQWQVHVKPETPFAIVPQRTVHKKDEARKKVKEECKRTEVGPVKQATLTQVLYKRTVYEKDSNRYKQVTRWLAMFVGATNVANSIVENPEFRELLQELYP